MAIQYKRKCRLCQKNYVLVTNRTRNDNVICFDCQKNKMEGEIADPEMKKLFDIPPEFYKESTFLRSIKINYLRFGSLSERQIEAFKDAVDRLKQSTEK